MLSWRRSEWNEDKSGILSFASSSTSLASKTTQNDRTTRAVASETSLHQLKTRKRSIHRFPVALSFSRFPHLSALLSPLPQV